MKTLIILAQNHHDLAPFRFIQQFIKKAVNLSIPLRVTAENSEDLTLESLIATTNKNYCFNSDLKILRSMLSTGAFDSSKLSDMYRNLIISNLGRIVNELMQGKHDEDIASMPADKLFSETLQLIKDKNIPYQGLGLSLSILKEMSKSWESTEDLIGSMNQSENRRIGKMVENLITQIRQTEQNGIVLAFNIGSVHAQRLTAHLKKSNPDDVNIVTIRCKSNHKYLSPMTVQEIQAEDQLILRSIAEVDADEIKALYSTFNIHVVDIQLNNNGFICPPLTAVLDGIIDNHKPSLLFPARDLHRDNATSSSLSAGTQMLDPVDQTSRMDGSSTTNTI